jgi:hypothetical protein
LCPQLACLKLKRLKKTQKISFHVENIWYRLKRTGEVLAGMLPETINAGRTIYKEE